MKQRNLIIGIVVSLIIIITVAVGIIKFGPQIKGKRKNAEQQGNSDLIQHEENVNKDEPLVGIIEKPQEEQEEYKDATMITQDLQEMDINIGRLYIPKTQLDTEVYCKQNPNKMEEMPCMLYTNLGPNQQGVTILVGHNRANGLLFSNNNMLEENDEFYFKDYTGIEKTYRFFSKFVTTGDDVSFYNTPFDTPVIAMQCCLTPTDTENVLIIMATAEN